MTTSAPPPRPQCEAIVKRGGRCQAPAKDGPWCINHDPARRGEHLAKGKKGGTRQGDEGTDLGTLDGIARRVARIVKDLEKLNADLAKGNATPEGLAAMKLAPVQLTALRNLADVVTKRIANAPKQPQTPAAPVSLDKALG